MYFLNLRNNNISRRAIQGSNTGKKCNGIEESSKSLVQEELDCSVCLVQPLLRQDLLRCGISARLLVDDSILRRCLGGHNYRLDSKSRECLLEKLLPEEVGRCVEYGENYVFKERRWVDSERSLC